MKRNGMRLRFAGLALGLCAPVAYAQPALSVTAVRCWTTDDVTRVAIEVSGEFTYRTDKISNPERIFFDIADSRLRLGGRERGITTIPVKSPILKQVRVAQTRPDVSRIVLDLTGPADHTVTKLTNPSRLIVEVRPAADRPAFLPEPVPASPVSQAAPPPAVAPDSAPVRSGTKPGTVSSSTPPTANPKTSAPDTVTRAASNAPASSRTEPVRESVPPPVKTPEPSRPTTEVSAARKQPAAEEETVDAPAKPALEAKAATPTIPESASRGVEPPVESAVPAKRNSNGSRSLTRALGLKIGRVVLDPGHGGHDHGTTGPGGLMEKDLVLDVALRLGQLIESRLGCEVVYTRKDDTFIPLEERTAIANREHADLFLSIHANSSPYPGVAGVESYYLNFTNSKLELEVAARENAGHNKSVYELSNLLEKIAKQDKRDESREFATRVQKALYPISARSNESARNRGVKSAPFVVLIGASMPSVLTEIGFVTNRREESRLKSPEYRQKVAEALFNGVKSYAGTLSHYSVAERQDDAVQQAEGRLVSGR